MARQMVLEKIKKLGIGMRTSKAGFTLIEVLVVLIIVAIITAVSVIAFGHFGRGRREKIIAQQFVRTIVVAQQQAILTPDVLGLGITPRGYRFYQYTISSETQSPEWIPLSTTVLSNPDAFKNVFQADVKIISGFDEKNNVQEPQRPQILFLPSGFVTPFMLELKGKSQHFLIDVKNNGVTTMTSGENNET
jgi:general secretion pathway protein H